MEIRLNKLISDSGLCSRREADRFIEAGRVTVNGQQPSAGMKVTEKDTVMLDGLQIKVKEYTKEEQVRATKGSAGNLIFGEEQKKSTSPKKKRSSSTATFAPENGVQVPKREKYGKYNKYAAARKAAKAGLPSPFARKDSEEQQQEKILQEAFKPKFGKSLSKRAVAQRLAAAPKSAALRKTSKNNPLNKAKRAAQKNNHTGSSKRPGNF